MKKQIHILGILLSFCLTICYSCKEKLDVKPNQGFLVPSTLTELQAVLDGLNINTSFPYGMEVASDNYYLLDAQYNSQNTLNQNIYVWDKNLYQGVSSILDWQYGYRSIFPANVAFEQLEKLNEKSGTVEYNNIKGQAAFLRAYCYHLLAVQYCKQYDVATANADLGLPLKLKTDVNERPARASVQQTYDQIIADAKLAISLLPNETSFKTRPTRAAANALLARVYLSMNQYDNALIYANAALTINNVLLNYNLLNPADPYPLKLFNPEVLFHGTIIGNTIFAANGFYVDDPLYQSYSANDLRKTCFFTLSGVRVLFKGSYTSSNVMFNGISNSEVYLSRAECLARANKVPEAMADLNELLKNRFKPGYINMTANGADDALNKILAERRKELLFRGLRWMDLKRLNKDVRTQATLTRVVAGTTYTLSPNDSKYVFPIPDSEVSLGGLEQNNRN